MNGVWFDLAVVALLVGINALLAGAEVAFLSLREGQLRGLAERGKRGQRVVRLARDPNRYLGAVQLGITFAGFLASATAAVSISEPVAEAFGGARYARGVAVALVTVVLSLITLVLGELVPKRLAMQRAERWALVMARPIGAFIAVTRPVIVLLSALTNVLVRAAGGDPSRHRTAITDEEIVDLVEAQPTLTDVQRQIMAGAIEIAERSLRQVLVPRNRVVSIDHAASVEQARDLLRASGHSRAPVVEATLDELVGQVHLRDLLESGGTAGERVSPILAFPESLSVLQALRELQANRSQLAAVVDEHGGTAGIITVEDLVEELVGEIYDEADRDLIAVLHEEGGSLLVPGSFPVHDLVDLDVDLPEGAYSTIAGLVLDRLGHLPQGGEQIVVADRQLEVAAVEDRTIVSVRIAPPSDLTGPGEVVD